MHLTALPALQDNYIWLLSDLVGASLVVDPGEHGPVLAAYGLGLRPDAVLLTHHHADHCAGVAGLLERWPDLQVIAPEDPRITTATRRVAEGATIEVGKMHFEVHAVPGHTSTHISFNGAGHLFCGDTLFSLGCGRLFEGTPAQMLASLDRLAALPEATAICCGHEYTLANAAFALTVDPGNDALVRRANEARAMRASGLPTLPVDLGTELATNPFLRVRTDAVREAVAEWLGQTPGSALETFAGLRRWKDGFRA